MSDIHRSFLSNEAYGLYKSWTSLQPQGLILAERYWLSDLIQKTGLHDRKELAANAGVLDGILAGAKADDLFDNMLRVTAYTQFLSYNQFRNLCARTAARRVAPFVASDDTFRDLAVPFITNDELIHRISQSPSVHGFAAGFNWRVSQLEIAKFFGNGDAYHKHLMGAIQGHRLYSDSLPRIASSGMRPTRDNVVKALALESVKLALLAYQSRMFFHYSGCLDNANQRLN